MHSLPNKQCFSDSQPTWLLKANANILSPFLCQLVNSCLEHGTVPSSFKLGYVTPLLKKADLDAADVKSYRPISNQSVVSKLLKRLVAQQLITYLMDNGLLPDLQSAYHAHHSTETAMLNVVGDILLALESGNLAVLSLLDLSAVFNTVDHDTLLRRLLTSYGLDGVVIKWFAAYLSRWMQHVQTPTTTSLPSPVAYGVPQGSVLGPILEGLHMRQVMALLFLLYVAHLLQLIKRHRLSSDTQIYGFCQPSDVNALADRVSACFDEVRLGCGPTGCR